MITILLVGVGGIGMRHAQSIASLEAPFSCWAVDPSEDSLNRTRTLLAETKSIDSFRFVCSPNQAPKEVDVAIVATSSLVRAKVVEELLASKQIKYLILEKFLFPRLSEYTEIGKLLTQKSIPCWVNTPRGMYPGWQTVAASLASSGGKLRYSLVGGGWGLGCNTIHYIDMLYRLLGCDPDFSFDTSGLDQTLLASKRSGYVEFTGTLRASHPRASSIEFVCERDGIMPPLQVLSADTVRFVISETEQRAWRASASDAWKLEEFPFPIRYQSQLTASVVESLIATGECALTAFEPSSRLHQALLSALLQHYNTVKEAEETLCPIT